MYPCREVFKQELNDESALDIIDNLKDHSFLAFSVVDRVKTLKGPLHNEHLSTKASSLVPVPQY